MEFPIDVPGLFAPGETRLDVAEWKRVLLGSNLPPWCALEQLSFCKATKSKQHEFIVLHFRHCDPSVTATARLIVDRAPNTSQRNNSYFKHSSSIASSSALHTSALDSILITSNTVHLETRLCKIYGSYKELCTLTFPATSKSACPSATQISVLLSVISQHAPDYQLCKFQCYWFANTIWETIKRLFPGYIEATWKRGRSHYLGVEVDTADSVDVVCNTFADEWIRFENEAEQKRQAERAKAQQLWAVGVAQGMIHGLGLKGLTQGLDLAQSLALAQGLAQGLAPHLSTFDSQQRDPFLYYK
ncbi:hypothetical protein BD769DRAFT_915502 [Suillus cothurnatus]|nr:hypothetical protein BD769DRAFT_915502 [Suillus cothurnatus]